MFKAFLLMCLILLASVTLPPANAHGFANKQYDRPLVVKDKKHAARIVKDRFGGKVLKASKKVSNGLVTYRVKLLKKDGRIVTITVDGHTARVR